MPRLSYNLKRPEQRKEKSYNKLRRFQERKAQKNAAKELSLL